MEVRGNFQIDSRAYSIFVTKNMGKVEGYLFENQQEGKLMYPIPIEISAKTRREIIGHWLTELKRYLIKQIRKKNG